MSNKLVNLDELELIIAQAKNDDKVVIHAHGCFDLLHIGHLRYFQNCKKKGDLLVVTITPDQFINKGPGRPAFNENLRLEFLTQIAIIDYVSLNNQPDAVELLKKLKPNFTMRGKEYIDDSKDITGKILLESKAIESVGGKLDFIDDLTFSSTQLLNNNIEFLDSDIKEYINKNQKLSLPQNTLSVVDNFKKKNVLIIGDTIIDEYIYTSVLGTVTKHPAISASFIDNKIMGGGGIALANHIASLSNKVSFHTTIGDKNLEYEKFVNDCLNKSSIEKNIIINQGDYTTVKTRYISSSGYPNPISGSIGDHKNDTSMRLFEIGYLPNKINKKTEKTLIANVLNEINEFDLVMISNFGHGLISKHIYEKIREKSKFIALNVQTNSSNFGFNLINKYLDADFICLDELEARLALSNKIDNIDDVALALIEKLNCNKLMITRGKHGINYYTDCGLIKNHSPALAKKVIDPVGAGDAVFAGSALAAHDEVDPNITLLIGSIMGMLATQIVGNEAHIELHELKQSILGMM